MTYSLNTPQLGLLPIASTDAGYTTANGTALAVPTPPMQPGMIVTATDPTYGTGEFILLKGVGSTAVGSIVTYNTSTFQTALAPVGTNKPQPVAIAMAATGASSWGWYQIGGLAVAKKTATVSLAANAAIGVLTVGLVAGTGTGKEVQGALVAAVASNVAGRTSVQIVLDRPHMQGRVT